MGLFDERIRKMEFGETNAGARWAALINVKRN